MSITNPLKLRFLTERYEKENRNIKLQEEFVLTNYTGALTSKFYAKHEVLLEADVKEEFLKHIEKHTAMKPKDIYNFRPPSVNMECVKYLIKSTKGLLRNTNILKRLITSARYGWFTEPLVPRSHDSRLYFSKKHCDFIKNELLIRKLHKSVISEKFTGTPFKL